MKLKDLDKKTRKKAIEENKKIYDEWVNECNRAKEDAIANGTWIPGLDTNRHIYEAANERAKQKIADLRKKYGIDED